jgi:hypothetical protein
VEEIVTAEPQISFGPLPKGYRVIKLSSGKLERCANAAKLC